MERSLDGQVALVTGAAEGLGAAIARRLAAQGARVVVHCRGRAAAAHALVDALGGYAAGHRVQTAELRDPEAVRALVDGAHAVHGRLDVLVNNVGRFERCPPLEVDYARWQAHLRDQWETNFFSAANASYCAARWMQARGQGRIVNVGSRGAFRGEPEAPGYGASKAALHQLTQSLAVALAPAGISVFAVAPGFLESALSRPDLTPEKIAAIRAQSPFGRVATLEDVAYWVACFASPEGAFASGTLLDVNGASYLRA